MCDNHLHPLDAYAQRHEVMELTCPFNPLLDTGDWRLLDLDTVEPAYNFTQLKNEAVPLPLPSVRVVEEKKKMPDPSASISKILTFGSSLFAPHSFIQLRKWSYAGGIDTRLTMV